MTNKLISNRADKKKNQNKSAAADFSEPCDCVTASEPCNITVYSDGIYYIEIDETKEPSYLAHEILYFEELD